MQQKIIRALPCYRYHIIKRRALPYYHIIKRRALPYHHIVKRKGVTILSSEGRYHVIKRRALPYYHIVRRRALPYCQEEGITILSRGRALPYYQEKGVKRRALPHCQPYYIARRRPSPYRTSPYYQEKGVTILSRGHHHIARQTIAKGAPPRLTVPAQSHPKTITSARPLDKGPPAKVQRWVVEPVSSPVDEHQFDRPGQELPIGSDIL
jgi:hypothetical protein